MRHILSAAAFFAVLLLLLAGLNRVFEYKGSREKLTPFFERADQIDVLFFGDSHTYSAIYPMELWADYGITSYNLSNYNLTIPISYWVMRNALRVCQPEVVVLDVNQVWEQAKLCASSSDMHTALDGFPMSRTKLEAILDLTDDPLFTDDKGHRYQELRPEFIFPLIKYHTRWNDLNAQDLKPQTNQELGGERNIAVALPEAYEITGEAADEQGFGFLYLRRFIEDCQSRGIRVLLTNLPYPCPNNNEEQLYTNAVVYTAEEYGVEYLDFVYMDQIVDYSTDCYDPASHLNPSGAWKVTDFIGQHLSETYGLPDHRGEAAYASWDSDYAAYCGRKLESIRQEPDPYAFLMLLSDPSFSTILLLPENSAAYADSSAMQLLQNAGRRHLLYADTDEAVWSDALMPLEQITQPIGESYLAVIDRGGETIGECVGSGTVITTFGSVTLDGHAATAETPGGSVHIAAEPGVDIHAAVIDPQSGEVLYMRTVRL